MTYLEEVELVEPQAIVYKGATNWDVHGWLMKPAGYVEGEKYPLIVEIHGGPHAMYANTFFHELQLLAAQGYGVLYVNPRGSHGYSQEFVDAVRGDYGGGDYEDIMAGLDYVIKKIAGLTRTARRNGWELRRFHDKLDRRPFGSFQSSCHATFDFKLD